jgi:predicted ABC-type transport system involved in lysophospholipase L1 biosynthesis ATPase subunit
MGFRDGIRVSAAKQHQTQASQRNQIFKALQFEIEKAARLSNIGAGGTGAEVIRYVH